MLDGKPENCLLFLGHQMAITVGQLGDLECARGAGVGMGSWCSNGANELLVRSYLCQLLDATTWLFLTDRWSRVEDMQVGRRFGWAMQRGTCIVHGRCGKEEAAAASTQNLIFGPSK